MKKLLLWGCGIIGSLILSTSMFFIQTTLATDFQHQNTEVLPGVPKASEGASNAEDLFGGDSADATKNLLSSIKTAINRVLGLLALIALIILIYQGVMMLVYARDSKKMEEGYATVKNVAIALVFIGVSWLVVSFIFRAIGQFTGT